MNDLLRRYLNPQARMTRGKFNLIFFCAFIPVLIIQLLVLKDDVGALTSQATPIMNMLNGAMTNTDFSNMDSVINQSNRMMDARKVVNSSFFGSSDDSLSLQELFGNILNFLIFIALIPAVHMRLRDIGKIDSDQIWYYTGLIYTVVVFNALEKILGIALPTFLTVTAGIISFFVLVWLCGAKGKERIPPHMRGRGSNTNPLL